MKFINKWALALVPALAVATPALALAPPGLADLTQPGSVIVYPKFVNASVPVLSGNGPATALVPQTEIEIGVVCPRNAPPGFCTAHQTVNVHFHWVCPAFEGVDSQICHETDFLVAISLNGKLAFSPTGTPINTNSPPVTPPPCARGYLIGWVVNNLDQPLKFDGLIGNAVLRGGPVTVGGVLQSTAVSAYSALGIQASEAEGPPTATANPGGLITLRADGSLPFTGLVNNYTTVTNTQYGDLKFDRATAGEGGLNGAVEVLSKTAITFLTLDVISGRTNDPTWIDLSVYNESLATVSTTNPFFERLSSDTVEIICWGQIRLVDLAGGSLTQAIQNTRKGVVIAKATDGGFNPVTLIGLVETIEGTTANGLLERKYNFNMSNGQFPITTYYRP